MPSTDHRHPLRTLLDDITMARLVELADVCHCDIETVASTLLRDVLEDDALAHELPEDFPTVTRQ